MNDKIVEQISKYAGPKSFTYFSPNDSQIKQAESLLEVLLPKQYIDFLKAYGHGGFNGFEILGFGCDGSMLFVESTFEYRAENLPPSYVVIENCDEWLYCINCTTGEVVSWSTYEEKLPAYTDFDTFLLDRISDAVENL